MTVARRQTAYRMRHCCARRIDKTGGRRKLLRTSTRWAERQRIVGAETSRIAKSLAASVSDAATQAVDSTSVAALRAAGLQWRGQGAGPLAFSWGSKGDILSRERISPLSAAPHGVGKSRSLFGLLPSAPCAEKERTSLSRSPLFLLIFCCAEAIIPLPASPLRQRQPSPVRRRNTARSARSASRTSRGTGSWSAGQWRSSSALPRGTRPR